MPGNPEVVLGAPDGQRRRDSTRYGPRMTIARVGFFDDPLVLQPDDERRRRSLHELLRSTPGLIAGYELRHEATGRLMHVSLWESEAALDDGERAVAQRPASDQRRINPSRVERWLVDRSF